MARIGAGGEIGGGTDTDTDTNGDTEDEDGGRPAPDERMEDIGVTPPDEREGTDTDSEPAPEPDQPARGRDRDSGDGRGSGGTGDVDETEPEPDPTDQPARGADPESGGGLGSGSPEPEPEPTPEPDQPTRGGGTTPATEPEDVTQEQTVTPEQFQETETFDTADIAEGEIATGPGVEQELEQAREFERQIVQERDVSPEDIAIERRGDELVALPTEAFVTERAAAQLGEREDVVDVQTGDGEITATFEPTQEELAQEFEGVPGVEQVYQRGSGDDGAVTAVVGLTEEQIENLELSATRQLDEAVGEGMREVRGERANISGELERRLEGETGAELTQEDIMLQREDGQIQAELTAAGQREVAAQQAPLQGTPVGPAFATGARARTRLQQFTQSNVERAQELANTDLLFGGEERFLGEVGETVGDVTEDRVPSPAELFGGDGTTRDRPELTGGAPVFAPGPGGFAGVSRGAAALGTLVGGATVGTAAAAQGEPVQAETTTEVDIPEDREVFQDELAMPETTESTPFVGSPTGSEVELPDPQEVEFIGVPEQGITIEPGEMRDLPGESELDVPEGGRLFGGSELDVPTEDAPTLAPETQQAIQRERGAGEERQVPSQTGETQVPQEFIPDEEVTIGGSTGSVVSGRPEFIGRTPRPETRFESFAERGFELPSGETPGVELQPSEMAQAGEAAGAGPLQAPFTGFVPGVTTAADADAAADVSADAAADVRPDTAATTADLTATGTGTGVAEALGVGPATVDAPGFEYPAPDLPRYGYEYPTPTTDTPTDTPMRLDLPEFGGDGDDREEEPFAPGRADIFTGFFDPLTGEEL